MRAVVKLDLVRHPEAGRPARLAAALAVVVLAARCAARRAALVPESSAALRAADRFASAVTASRCGATDTLLEEATSAASRRGFFSGGRARFGAVPTSLFLVGGGDAGVHREARF